MGKRSTRKKRGIQRGVGKHEIKSKALAVKQIDLKILGLGEHFYLSIARKCVEVWLYWCSKLYLTPFTRTATGQYVPLDPRSKLIHFFVWFVKFLMLLHKLAGLTIILMYEELKIETFMCTSYFLIFLVSFGISLGMIARPKETMDLMNSWPYILSCLRELQNDELSVFDDLSTALKITSVFLVTQGIAITAAFCSLVFSTLPTCYFPTAESLGLIPHGLLPRFAWQLLFFPLEYITNLPPMFSAPFAGSLILILVGVFKIVGREIR